MGWSTVSSIKRFRWRRASGDSASRRRGRSIFFLFGRVSSAPSDLPPSGSIGFRRVDLDLSRFDRVLAEVGLGWTSSYRDYWVLLGFTGFYWVVLGFTGFYWVLLGFT